MKKALGRIRVDLGEFGVDSGTRRNIGMRIESTRAEFESIPLQEQKTII